MPQIFDESMPFTPLHMGPGLLIKAVAGRNFSLLTFGVAQIVMDIEPLVGIIRDSEVLHGYTHTYLAALVIVPIVVLIAPILGRPILRRWNRELSYYHLDCLVSPESWAHLPVIMGAFSGTLFHIVLDSIMHADIRPLVPWSNSNVLLDLVSIDALNQGCLVAGVVGAIAWLFFGWYQRERNGAGHPTR